MSRPLPFTQVDVFTATPLRGNPLAVVHGADALSDTQMQDLARWTHLSETTFLLRPTATTDDGNAADYRVRIFTPGGELPFAGHPTLGSCHAWLERGGVPRRAGEVVQECGVGLVRIRCDGEKPAFQAPPLRAEAVDDATLAPVLAALGLQCRHVRAAVLLDNGPTWLCLQLDSAATVLGVEPDHAALRCLPKIGLVGPYPEGGECAFEVRAFAASVGVDEDPVTGSLNASLGQWLIERGGAPERYVASQGTRLGRSGRVFVSREAGAIWVGGHSVSCIRGEVVL